MIDNNATLRALFIEIAQQRMESATIIEVNDEHILFSNGSEITYDHQQDCCEWNYADFNQIEESALNYNFTMPIQFESIDGAGFRFGNPGRMFFIPCYSEQNGYYSSDVEIYFNNREVLFVVCDEPEEGWW